MTGDEKAPKKKTPASHRDKSKAPDSRGDGHKSGGRHEKKPGPKPGSGK